ncbi:MAG: Ig-like domain-containing protein [Eubacterium sp.]|nr:Ig-like domain-containing protein [Eubacterium sp.]
MRKSFKKVMATVLAASLVVSTPIATKTVSNAEGVAIPDPVYTNDFESDDGSAIAGTGAIVAAADTSHGKVFDNGAGEAGKRTNYYKLPSLFAENIENIAANKGFSFSFDVNANGKAAMYAPIFSAYASEVGEGGANSFPMFIAQGRGLLQVNAGNWSDFTAAENVAGANTESVAYLGTASEWHNVTVTVTSEGAGFYVDGNAVNEWDHYNNDIAPVFTADGIGKCVAVCLGGNQAWDWNDNDSQYQYDNFKFYDTGLTQEQVQVLSSGINVISELNLVLNDNEAKTGSLNATIVGTTENTIQYESADSKIATVDENGVVTAVANGSTTITVTCGDATATVAVNVTTAPKDVKIKSDALDKDGELTVNLLYDSDKKTYAADDAVALTAAIDPETSSNTDIVWSVSGSAVTVTDDGKVAAATTAKEGDTAEVTATVKGTDISDTITVNVKVVDTKFVDATAVTVSPAAVTATAGEEVAFTASVTAGTEVPTDKTVTWTTDAGTITDAGVLTVPANAKEGDVITVTAASTSNPEVKGTASVKVHLTETLTGTAWWGGHQTSKDRILKGNGSVSFIIEKSEPYSDAFGFCVEAYAVDENGNKAVYDGDLVDAADATVDEKGSYITVSYNGSYEGWVAGYPKSTTAKTTPDMYSVEKSEVGYAAENVYQVTFTREDDDYLCLIKDLTNNEWFWTYVAKDVDMNSEYLGVHFMAQLGTYVLVDTTDHLTTDNTAKPVQVTPKPRATATPTPAADSSNSGSTATATATPTPAASATTTDSSSNSTLKAAKITVKKGKKAVKKVTVKKTKKVKLKISTTSDAKVKLKKLSKKQKKIAKVTLKGKKLTIKGKKKGKITLKLTTAKTSTYKKATKKIKVVVK